MSQHNLPPVEKRHVLLLGEKGSILLSSINLELATFFSLYHFRLPTTVSLRALLHLQDPRGSLHLPVLGSCGGATRLQDGRSCSAADPKVWGRCSDTKLVP